MKTSASLFGVALITVAILFSYASVDAEKPTSRDLREPGRFTAIEVGGGIDVEIRQGNEYLAEVIASENDLDDVITDVSGTLLSIRMRSGAGNFFGIFPVSARVVVTTPELISVRASGGSDVESVGTISGDSLKITASGGADVRMDVEVALIEVATSGGSDVDVSGKADTAEFRSSGGSDINSRDLDVPVVQVQSSGGSDINLAVSSRLTGNVSGGSDVYYIGNPETVDVNVSGGGELSGR